MIFVLGIDAATWTIVRPNLGELPTFRWLCDRGKSKELVLTEKPLSPLVWCGMFCGKAAQEHGHESFVADGNIVKREDIKVDFIWDILQKAGKEAKVLNVPFIVPPYSFGVTYKPIGFGLPTNAKEWQQELDIISEKTEELLAQKPDLLVSVYTLLDRIQHFHWGEDCVLEWYKRLDSKIGKLVVDTGFLNNEDNSLIVISDHGFCSFGEAKVQTLPKETEEGTLKGDHHENALLITVNLDYEINKPQDVFNAIRDKILNQP